MNDRKAFVGAIRANPADDLARMAFADWLDDQAVERGEQPPCPLAAFIRLECELAILKRPPTRNVSCSCRFVMRSNFCDVCQGLFDTFDGMTNHARRLWGQHWPEWTGLADLPDAEFSHSSILADGYLAITQEIAPSNRNAGLRFRRGLVTSVECDWPFWETFGDTLYDWHPVELVIITGERPTFRERVGMDGQTEEHLVAGRTVILSGPPYRLREVEHVARCLQIRWPGVKFDLNGTTAPIEGYRGPAEMAGGI